MKNEASELDEAAQPRRDIRIDRVGLVNELVTQFQKPLIDKIKLNMTAGERIAGDLFGGLLVVGASTDVDPDKFLQAYEKGKMTRAQFVSAIKPVVSRVKEILGETDLNRISTQNPTAPSLRPARLKGVEIQLVDAVKEISAALAG